MTGTNLINLKMEYIKTLSQTFYAVELDNNYYITNQSGFSKRISYDQYEYILQKE